MKTPLYTTLNSTLNDDSVITSLCRSLPSDTNADSGLWLPLIPIGAFAGRDGRSWTNSDPEAVINNTTLPFIVDIDHASETTPNTEASGWITKLKIENNHILGLFERSPWIRGLTAREDCEKPIDKLPLHYDEVALLLKDTITLSYPLWWEYS